jgi:hypothetical protein
MKKTNFIYLRFLLLNLILIILTSSCSKDESQNFDNTQGETAIVKLKIKVSDNNKNIFEDLIFEVHSENDDSNNNLVMGFDLSKCYDSILWKTSNMDGSFKIFEQNNNSMVFHKQWANSFPLPGNYTTYLLGYKNNKLIYSDSLAITISNNKDFLGHNWTDADDFGHSDNNNLTKDYHFSTFKKTYQNLPYVGLNVYANYGANNDLFISQNKSQEILLKYINSLYSTPIYSVSDGNLLIEKYKNLFNYQKANAIPLYIWVTTKVKIVLLKSPDFPTNFAVYAESNM